MNFAAYDHRQNKGKSNKAKHTSGKNVGQNNSGVHTSSNNNHPSRKPPGMEGKCMRCGKPEHQPGQKCAAKNAKCKECHKIGHFHKVCQSKKGGRRAHLVQIAPQSEPNPPTLNMLKIVNHWSHQGITGETSQVSNQCRPKRTLQAPSSGKS